MARREGARRPNRRRNRAREGPQTRLATSNRPARHIDCKNDLTTMTGARRDDSEEAAPASSRIAGNGHRTPRASCLDEAYSKLFCKVLLPAWERIVRRRDTLTYLDYLEKSQWLPPEAREEHTVLALRGLLSYVGENVPYYKDLFATERFDPRAVTSRKDLEALPLLTREIVRERYDDLVDPAHKGTNLKKGTSGSTGTPLKFEYSPTSECWRQAVKLRGYRWAGFRPGLKTFYYWAVVSAARPTLKTRLHPRLAR